MEILLFGITKDIVGTHKLTVPASAEVFSVAALRQWLIKQYPEINKLSTMAIAVDSEYAGDDTLISSNSEIALLPPVSGG